MLCNPGTIELPEKIICYLIINDGNTLLDYFCILHKYDNIPSNNNFWPIYGMYFESVMSKIWPANGGYYNVLEPMCVGYGLSHVL